MSLSQVFSSIAFLNPTSAASTAFIQFRVETRDVIRTAYLGSSSARDMFDRLVSSGGILNVNYVPGAASANTLTLNLDPSFQTWLLGTDGVFHSTTYSRIFGHEASHAIDNTLDPLFGLTAAQRTAAVADPLFDFSGATVRVENAIALQLGESWTRGSYFASSRNGSFNGVTDFTFGNKVDQVVILGQLGLSSNYLSMESRATADDLLIGSSNSDTLLGGAGKDFIWSFSGSDSLFGGQNGDFLFGGNSGDTLFGGNGGDTLFGGAGSDWLDGGTGILGDQMYGATGNDTYVINNTLDTVQEVVNGGTDSAVIQPGSIGLLNHFSFDGIEIVRVESTGARNVTVSGDLIQEIWFDDEGGTITYKLAAAPTSVDIDVNFSTAADVFVFDTNGFDPATGVVWNGVPIGFYWGFTCNGVGSNDSIDLTDLAIDALILSNLFLSVESGRYLMAPHTQIDFGDTGNNFWNSTDSWYLLDAGSRLFSPYLFGSITASNLII